MNRILLFAGTKEGRLLAEALAGRAEVTVCVATGYGGELLTSLPSLRVREGRMDRGEMAALLQSEPCDVIVDATHPYAAEVSRNIREVAADSGVPLLRLARTSEGGEAGDCIRVPDIPAAVAWLKTVGGNALLATGAKELDAFTALPDFRERLYVRVLPVVESLERCAALGYPPSHILAMQGPFPLELNIAVLRHWNIHILVTKDSGSTGGFLEKVEAARAAGATLLVVDRPDAADGGLCYEDLLQTLLHRLEESI